MKTIIHTQDGHTIEQEGDSGLTATLRNKGPEGEPFINVEWDMMDLHQAVTILKDIMEMMYLNMPGVVPNAIRVFAEDHNMFDKNGNLHLYFKKSEHKETDYRLSSSGKAN